MGWKNAPVPLNILSSVCYPARGQAFRKLIKAAKSSGTTLTRKWGMILLSSCEWKSSCEYESFRICFRWPGATSLNMMTSSNGNIFRVTGYLCGEFTGHRWIPHTKTSDTELLCFFFICAWINGWVNNREAGDLRRHCAHFNVIVMNADDI